MKTITWIFIVSAFATSCSKETMEVNPFAPGSLVQSPVDGTVIRVTEEYGDYAFGGVIVDSVNPSSVCSGVGAIKSEYVSCTDCTDFCK